MSRAPAPSLPPGWVLASLPDICEINPPLDRCVLNDAVHVNFVPMKAVDEDGGGISRPESCAFGEVRKGYTPFLSGDVIMAKITPCMENGKTTVVPPLPGEVCFGSTEFHVFRSEHGVGARWLAKYFVQQEFRQTAKRQMGGGVGQMRVPTTFLETVKLPLAPSDEQQRILDSIDELLSDLDAGVAALERVQKNLVHYRAAVLKAAVEGDLTADWRAQHPDTEPASVLLPRILTERRRRWEEDQLHKFKEAGKEPPKNWKDKYSEPVAPEETPLPPLHSGWSVASMDALTSRITSGSRDWQQYYGSGTGTFVMAQNVRPARFDMRTRQLVNPPDSDSSVERSRIEKGDLLVTIVGANTGDVCRVPDEIEQHFVCQSVALMRPVVEPTSRYLELYFNSVSGGQLHFNRYLYGAGRPHLSFDQLKMTPVLVPSLAEQEAIAEAVEDQLSVIGHLEADIAAKLKSALGLRQSILRHAFTGQLVPQDPNDEPASELLKRIATEREERARLTAAARLATRQASTAKKAKTRQKPVKPAKPAAKKALTGKKPMRRQAAPQAKTKKGRTRTQTGLSKKHKSEKIKSA